MEKNKGVTLIALIITIIILIILATLTLNFVLGDSGIIAKARISKRKNKSKPGKRKAKISKVRK